MNIGRRMKGRRGVQMEEERHGERQRRWDGEKEGGGGRKGVGLEGKDGMQEGRREGGRGAGGEGKMKGEGHDVRAGHDS